MIFNEFLWLDELEFDLSADLLRNMILQEVNSEPKPFQHVTYVETRDFVGYGVTELREALQDFLNDRGLNHGIIMTYGGILIFSEEEWQADPLIFKLTTGTSIGKQQQFNLSHAIKSKPNLLKAYPNLVRE